MSEKTIEVLVADDEAQGGMRRQTVLANSLDSLRAAIGPTCQYIRYWSLRGVPGNIASSVPGMGDICIIYDDEFLLKCPVPTMTSAGIRLMTDRHNGGIKLHGTFLVCTSVECSNQSLNKAQEMYVRKLLFPASLQDESDQANNLKEA